MELFPQTLLTRHRRPELARHALELPVALAREIPLACRLRLSPGETRHQPLDLGVPLAEECRGIRSSAGRRLPCDLELGARHGDRPLGFRARMPIGNLAARLHRPLGGLCLERCREPGALLLGCGERGRERVDPLRVSPGPLQVGGEARLLVGGRFQRIL